MSVFWQFVVCAITGFVIATVSFFTCVYKGAKETWDLARLQLEQTLGEEQF